MPNLKFPEILVERDAVMPSRISWVDDKQRIDMSGMSVLHVTADIPVQDVPTVTITFRARLVDVEP